MQALTAEWAHLDSNQGPTGYEPAALPLSYGPLERETGLEPALLCLEGRCFTTKLLPLTAVGVIGLEPTTSASQTLRATPCATPRNSSIAHLAFSVKVEVLRRYSPVFALNPWTPLKSASSSWPLGGARG